MIQNGYDALIIDEPGLTVCKSIPYLAASLDGIVKFKENSWGLEIKCSFSKYNSTLAEALDDNKFFLNKKKDIQLKRSHPNSSPNVLFRIEENGPCCLVWRSRAFICPFNCL